MRILATKKSKEKTKEKKNKNKEVLRTYFELLYDGEYANALVAKNNQEKK